MADVQLSAQGAVIKTAYEGEADTNAFRDADLGLLAGTGVQFGGDFTIGTGFTFAISALGGRVSDISDPENIVVTDVTRAAGNHTVSVPNQGDGPVYIFVNSVGTVVEVVTTPTPAQTRAMIFLGRVVIQGGAIIVVQATAIALTSLVNTVVDIARKDGKSLLSGCVLSAAATDLTVDMSAGSVFSLYANFHIDPEDPNRIAIAAAIPLTWRYGDRNATIASDVTVIDPGNWDNAGTVEAIAGSNNQSTIHTVTLFPGGNIRITYGQEVFGTLSAGLDGISSYEPILPTVYVEEGIIIGYWVVTKGCTDLSNASTAVYRIAQSGAATGGVTAHANLTGLAADDHIQYPLISSQAGVPSTTPSRLWLVNIDTVTGIRYTSTGTASSGDWTPISKPSFTATNNSGANMAVGVPVYLDATGIHLSESDASGTIPVRGVVDSIINNGASGEVVNHGIVSGFDTSTFAIGDTLYPSITAGIFTNVEPADGSVQPIGFVTTVHPTTGSMFVDIQIDGAATAVKSQQLSAIAMEPTTTAGAALSTFETATNDRMIMAMAFDASSDEHAQVEWVPPLAWDGGTVDATFIWTHPPTTTNFGVAWAIRASAPAEGNTLDSAYGTAIVTTDTGSVTAYGDFVSVISAAITISGAPAGGRPVSFDIFRDVSDGFDDLAVDAWLREVRISYVVTSASDA